MDALFLVTDSLPTPPGSSPFRARGLFYDNIVRSAVATPGGLPGLLSQITDERIRAFMRQQFRWTEWYDALPMVPVQAALCRLQGGDFEVLVRKRARAAAESLVPRMFRVVLGLGSPKAAAEHLPRLLSSHYNFGDLKMNVKDGHGTGLVRNVPRLIAAGYVNTVLGLVEGALHLMRARSIEGAYSDVTLGEPLHGFETITCRATFRWVK